jgi:hypothetical protein
MSVANVAIMHRIQVFHTRGFRTAIPSHGGNLLTNDLDLAEAVEPSPLSTPLSLASVDIVSGVVYTEMKIEPRPADVSVYNLYDHSRVNVGHLS